MFGKHLSSGFPSLIFMELEEKLESSEGWWILQSLLSLRIFWGSGTGFAVKAVSEFKYPA